MTGAFSVALPLGVILAGGLARRMGGGDKGLRLLSGRPLLAHICARTRPQASELILNANGDPARLTDALSAVPDHAAWMPSAIVPDSLPDHPGPLAGILAAMEWAAARRYEHVLSVPGDAPFLPPDLTQRLQAARSTLRAGPDCIAIACSAGQDHPVIGLWPVALRSALRTALHDGVRRVGQFTAAFPAARAAWPVIDGRDPFTNINTQADLTAAENRQEVSTE